MFKALAFLSLIAIAKAGAPALAYQTGFVDPHFGAQAEHTVRGFGGLSSVSKQTKAVDGAFSSVRKYDTRITNDAVGVHHAYAAPAYAHHAVAAAPAYAHHAYAAPAVAHVAAPAYAHHAYAAPAVAAPAYAHHAYAAPAYAAPAYAHHAYAAPAVAAVAAPAYAHHAYAPTVAKVASPLGVAYSPISSPGVFSLNFQGHGINYAY